MRTTHIPPADALQVAGLTPFSTLDYPGQLSAVVWVQGCPWRCGYCHNPHLQARGQGGQLAWSAVQQFLQQRVGLLDAVVFSGGEATVDKALPAAMAAVKAMGFRVGLHTAGCYPARLDKVLPLCDWVGLDVKTLWADYDQLTATPGSGRAAEASLNQLLLSGVPHQIRTTVHEAWLPAGKLLALQSMLSSYPVASHVLQPFRKEGCREEFIARLL
ncbi:anaerobic ribonucleoside-triphosphate reductase activating protein [Chitinivorax tropicus]|uniref:Anaerobic ribonucleoside-triphosphate reductase activating protein n=1 Tax=Chitinivorax tropicus TaxID=714531 RepID=A0A840MKV9_9PROT|nr:anaerobic ribonucleoside-triphosphate reductase activating protein [Chitinivorax tropicus]MBB5019288.1 anaerobic ribonucleoside-triphosphate reductase activating protein [Chitinivorax tropicus]